MFHPSSFFVSSILVTALLASSAFAADQKRDLGQELFCHDKAKGNYQLVPFYTDACSSWPDGGGTIGVARDTYYGHCCIVHDIAYWTGGVPKQKQDADLALNKCVEKATNRTYALMMQIGVKFGGVACVGTGWRWGYGWVVPGANGKTFKSDRKTVPLTDEERSQRRQLLEQAKVTAISENRRYFNQWCEKVRRGGNKCGNDGKALEISEQEMLRLLGKIVE